MTTGNRLASGEIAIGVLAASDPLGLGILNLSGRVLAVGAAVGHLRVGDLVYGTAALEDPALAVSVDARRFARRPESLTAIEAAAFPSYGAMALSALTQAGLAAGESLLVMDAASPVGALAVQIGKALGATVTGCCRDREVPMVLDLGADAVRATDRSSGNHVTIRGIRLFDVVLAPDPSDLEGIGHPRVARVEPVALVDRAVLEQLGRFADEHGCAPHAPRVCPPASFPAGLKQEGSSGCVVCFFGCDP